MGVQGLWDLLSPVGYRVSNEHVRNKIVAVDISIWLTQFVKAMRDAEGAQVRNSHLLGVFRRCLKLLFLSVKPVLVFDGSTPAIKRRTLASRRAQREKQEAKLRRLAEKMLLNQVKKKAISRALADKQIRIRRTEDQHHVNLPKERSSVVPCLTEANDNLDPNQECEDRIEPNLPSSKELDGTSQPENLLKNKIKGWSHGSSANDAYDSLLVENEENEVLQDEPIILPENLDNIDDEALVGLPANVQAEVFKQIKGLHRTKHRENMMQKQDDPAEFSKAQIQGFLRHTSLNKRIANVRNAIKVRTGASQRIASDSRRQFLLEEDALSQSDNDKNDDDSDDDFLERAYAMDTSSQMDILSRIRANKDTQRNRFLERELADVQNKSSKESHSGVGWASKVLEGNGSLALGGTTIQNVTSKKNWDRSPTKDSHIDADCDEDIQDERIPSVAERNSDSSDHSLKDVCEPVVDNGSDSDNIEWEDGAEKSEYPFDFVTGECVPNDDPDFPNVEDSPTPADRELQDFSFDEDRNSSIGEKPPEDEMHGGTSRNDINDTQFVAGNHHIGSSKKTPGPVSLEPARAGCKGYQDKKAPKVSSQHLPISDSPKVSKNENGDDCLFPNNISKDVESDPDVVRKVSEEVENPNVECNQGTEPVYDEERTDIELAITRSLQNEYVRHVVDTTIENDTLTPVHDSTVHFTKLSEQTPLETKKARPVSSETKERNSTSRDLLQSNEQAILKNMSMNNGNGRNGFSKNKKDAEPNAADSECNTPAVIHTNGKQIGTFNKNDNKDSIGTENPLPVPSPLSQADMEVIKEDLEKEERGLRKQKSKFQGAFETVSDEMYAETRDLLKLFGIPYIQAPMEAEAQCAFLNLKNVVDGVITEDSDAFLFGAQTVYRHLFAEGKFAEAYEANDINKSLALDRDHLIRLAYLLGSDYTPGVRGVGVVNAMEILEAFPGSEGLKEFQKWTEKITILDEEPDEEIMQGSSAVAIRRQFCWKHRNMKRNWEIREGFPHPAVSEAYINPAVDHSTEKFRWGAVDFEGLTEFCWSKFGWEKERFENTVGPLRQQMKERSVRQQRRIDEFFKPHRFARIRSERLKKAVKGMAGDDAEELMAPPLLNRGKRNAQVMAYQAREISEEEDEMVRLLEESEGKRRKR